MSTYTIHIKKSWWRQKWFLRLVADNGKTIMHGENLNNYMDALSVAENIAKGSFIIIDNDHTTPTQDAGS